MNRIEELMTCRDLMEKCNYPMIMLVNITETIDKEIQE